MITVVVTIFNCEKYLSSCIDSILSQTYQPEKILLINDMSTDGSMAICLDYEKRYNNILIIQSTKKSVGGARNVGLKHVKTKYVYFIDCDDTIIPCALETLLNECETNQLDVVTGLSIKVDEKGVLTKRYITYPSETKVMSSEQYLDFIINNALIGVNVWGNLYKTSLFKQNKQLFKEGIVLEDLASIISVGLCVNRAKFIPFVFYHYYQHPTSIMRSKRDWAKVFYNIYLNYENAIKPYKLTTIQKESINQYICYVVSECLGKAFASRQGMNYVKKLKKHDLIKESIFASNKRKHKLLRLLYTHPRLLGLILSIYKRNSTQ